MKDHLKVYADFNSGTNDGYPWILKCNDKDLLEQLNFLGLKIGDYVLLYQDNDDFVVPARLAYGFVSELDRESLYAIPDWERIVRSK